jgi:hypothetical protein
MRVLTVVGPAFLDPDAVGPFPDLALVDPAAVLIAGELPPLDAAGTVFLVDFPLLFGALAMRSPRVEFTLALPFGRAS